MDAKVFELELVDNQGCGWFSGLEAHPTKSVGVFVYGYHLYGHEHNPVRFSRIEVHKVPTVEVESWTPRGRSWRKKTSKVTVLPEAFEGREDGLIAFGLIVQGRYDWANSGMTGSDDTTPPKWEEIVWEDNSHCPLCKKNGNGNEVELKDCSYYVFYEGTTVPKEEVNEGRLCSECGTRFRNDSPVPRSWGMHKLLPVHGHGEYDEEVMRGKWHLDVHLGIDDADFPSCEEGQKRIEMPELNHFNRTSGTGTCMWAIPTLVLDEDKTWRIELEIDAVSRIKKKLKEKGVKINRDAKAVYEKLNWIL